MKSKADVEWVELLELAKEYGFTVDEIRDFLQNSRRKMKIGAEN